MTLNSIQNFYQAISDIHRQWNKISKPLTPYQHYFLQDDRYMSMKLSSLM